ISLRAQLVSREGRTRWMRDGALVADGRGNRGPFAFVNDGRKAMYFAWADPRLTGQTFAQRFLANGRPAPGWPHEGKLVSPKASGDPNNGNPPSVRLVATASGFAIASWSDQALGSLVMLLTPRGPAAPPVTPVAATVAPEAAIPLPPALSFGLLAVTPHPV